MKKFIYLLLFFALLFVFLTSCSEPEKLPKNFSSEEEKELEEYCKTLTHEALEGDETAIFINEMTDASQEDLERALGYNLREGLGFTGNYSLYIECSISLAEGARGDVTFSHLIK
jgi:hypothetical protein